MKSVLRASSEAYKLSKSGERFDWSEVLEVRSLLVAQSRDVSCSSMGQEIKSTCRLEAEIGLRPGLKVNIAGASAVKSVEQM